MSKLPVLSVIPMGRGPKSPTSAALDLTPLAQLLPVMVDHENDVFPKAAYPVGSEVNDTPSPFRAYRIVVSNSAPGWLKDVDFTGVTPGSYHLLAARPDATVLLGMDGVPLLIAGRFGKGQVIAYTGFSPEGSAKLGGHTILDRAIRSSAENRLFAIIGAAVLALASGEGPPLPIKELLEARATPLYETLKNAPRPGWPYVSLSWAREPEGHIQARIRIQNKSAHFFRGFRLRFEGPDFLSGQVLALWSDQYFDLLPGEEAEATVGLISADHRPLQSISLVGEAIYGSESEMYSIPRPP